MYVFFDKRWKIVRKIFEIEILEKVSNIIKKEFDSKPCIQLKTSKN